MIRVYAYSLQLTQRMATKMGVLMLISLALWVAGCSQVPSGPNASPADVRNLSTGPGVCSPSYIRVGGECCLDGNNNSVCDSVERPREATATPTPESALTTVPIPNALLRLTNPSADGFCLEHVWGDSVRLSELAFYIDGARVHPVAPENLTSGGIATISLVGGGLKQGSQVTLAHRPSQKNLSTFLVEQSLMAGTACVKMKNTEPSASASSPSPTIVETHRVCKELDSKCIGNAVHICRDGQWVLLESCRSGPLSPFGFCNPNSKTCQ